MILGRTLRTVLALPGLRLESDRDSCIHCGRCSDVCPMSLPVQQMVERQDMDHVDCILCGSCKDACPKSVVGWSFGRPQTGRSPRRNPTTAR
ncbi:MAG: 4Fe-4S binding protein [Armatimonadota bacterium]